MDICTNCQRDTNSDRLRAGRCMSCYRYWRKHGVERQVPAQRWCDCGHAATHYDVRLPVLTVETGKLSSVVMDLCEDCCDLEFEK